jgi:hypothetical protein|tara:strand:- start:35 stop:241 length:207 start_codon:yes stop_codon:yes gene_type:complete
MSLKDRIIEGLDKVFEAKIQSHIMNIEVLLGKPVGVAEHPDIMATIEGELDIIASYEDKRSCLKKYFL